MSDAVSIWWLALCTAAALNVAAWAYSARQFDRRGAALPPDVHATRRAVLWLSALYVLGCAFRSLLPMIDVPRTCLHDTWVSRIVVGRSVATVAELCFVAQWALLLREAAAAARHRFASAVAGVLVPIIVIAECASWYAVLTTNNAFHALENSLWTVSVALLMVACVAMRPRVEDSGRRFLDAAVIFGALYVLFMVTVDVPMYLSRWMADTAADHRSLGLAEGLRQLAQRCIVRRDWAAWREDVPWLTLYFTLAVWLSIALVHVTPFRGMRQDPRRRARASGAAQPE